MRMDPNDARDYLFALTSINGSLFSPSISLSLRVSDAGVRHIIESTAGSHLRELNLTNCVKISDVTLLRMSQRWVHGCCIMHTYAYTYT